MSDTSISIEVVQAGMAIEHYVDDYDDPEADMILRSNDEDLFRVHSYYLKATSAYFRFFTLPLQLGTRDDSTPIIDIDGSTPVLRMLLDQISSATPPKIEAWSTARLILKLGERYSFGLLPKLLVYSIEPCLKSDPHEVFAFASQHDFENLAKSALTNFGEPWRRASLESILEGVSVKYIPALIRAMRISEDKICHNVVWTTAARIFEIKR